MREYKETPIEGKQYTRCKGVQINNELNSPHRTILFHEETVAVMGDKVMSSSTGAVTNALTAQNADTEFDIIDFDTMQPTGQKATYAEVYAMLASLYLHSAQKRDADEIYWAEQAEQQRLAEIKRQEEQAEQERLHREAEEAARVEAERLALENQKAMSQAEADSKAALAAQRLLEAETAAKAAADKAEAERVEAERLEADRKAAEDLAKQLAEEAQAASDAAAASSAAAPE